MCIFTRELSSQLSQTRILSSRRNADRETFPQEASGDVLQRPKVLPARTLMARPVQPRGERAQTGDSQVHTQTRAQVAFPGFLPSIRSIRHTLTHLNTFSNPSHPIIRFHQEKPRAVIHGPVPWGSASSLSKLTARANCVWDTKFQEFCKGHTFKRKMIIPCLPDYHEGQTRYMSGDKLCIKIAV